MLQVRNLTKRFGGLEAISDLDFEVTRGEILGLIGPNGSGKTTALNIISGFLSPTRGKVIFKGEEITRLPPYRSAQRGMSRVFQRNILFRSFTVLENVLVGFHVHSRKGIAEIFYKHDAARIREKDEYEKVVEILQWVGLSDHKNDLAMNLPHGSQRALGLAVALATEPELLLLDEPLTGMNAEETAKMMEIIRTLRLEKSITSIVVEHNVKAVLDLCDKAIVLDYGKKIAEGLPNEVIEKPEVIEAYLGVDRDAA